MQATPGTPYRVYYMSKGLTPGLTGITAKIRYPDGSVVGPYALTEVLTDIYYSGVYYLDVTTLSSDPVGEYLVMIVSANEGYYRTYQKIEYRVSSGSATGIAASVWSHAVRGLTESVAVNNVDLSNLATHTDVSNAVAATTTSVWSAPVRSLTTAVNVTPSSISTLATHADVGLLQSNLYSKMDTLATHQDIEDLQVSLDTNNLATHSDIANLQTHVDASLSVLATHQDIVNLQESLDLTPLATHADITALQDYIVSYLHTWETKGSISLDPLTNSMELVAWLTKDGEVVLDSSSATVELRDVDDILLTPVMTDTSVSASGLFKFTQGGASAIIIKNRTYVMKITITRGAQTYQGNVSISTY